MSTSALTALQQHCDVLADEHARSVDMLRALRAMFFGDPVHQRLLCEEYGVVWTEGGGWFLAMYPLLNAELDQLLIEIHTPHDHDDDAVAQVELPLINPEA